MEPRQFKQFIEQAAGLSQRQRADLLGRLNSSLLQEKAAALIEAAAPQPACPRCRSVRLHRHGHAHGLQRYRCADCARTFNALTGTPLARLRHRAKWLTYLDCMPASGTVRRAAALAGVHKNTSFRWRHRFLAAARTDRSWPLGGITEADETYLPRIAEGVAPHGPDATPARRIGAPARDLPRTGVHPGGARPQRPDLRFRHRARAAHRRPSAALPGAGALCGDIAFV
jgi:transposase-like protein